MLIWGSGFDDVDAPHTKAVFAILLVAKKKVAVNVKHFEYQKPFEYRVSHNPL